MRGQLLLILFILPILNSCALFRLLNSGTANIKYRVSEATLNGVKYEEKSRLTSPSISIRNVQHPTNYDRWDLNFRITPSLHADDQRYQTGATFINPETGNRRRYHDINIRRGIILANMKLTSHTPIGAFALSAGFGGTVYKIDDGQGLNSVKTREIRRLDFVYYGFMSKRFFILMGPRYYNAGYETYEFAFRIGYFWGSASKS